MKHVMIDFETLGNGKNACLLQVGAVYFDSVTGDMGRTFKGNVDPESHAANGGVIDASTVKWWMGQSQEARESVMAPGSDVHLVMNRLNDFLEGAEHIWSHATFDFVILQETLRRLGIKPKFSFRAARDIRTLMFLHGKEPHKTEKRGGVHHDALDDAIFQVKYTVKAINSLKRGRK